MRLLRHDLTIEHPCCSALSQENSFHPLRCVGRLRRMEQAAVARGCGPDGGGAWRAASRQVPSARTLGQSQRGSAGDRCLIGPCRGSGVGRECPPDACLTLPGQGCLHELDRCVVVDPELLAVEARRPERIAASARSGGPEIDVQQLNRAAGVGGDALQIVHDRGVDEERG